MAHDTLVFFKHHEPSCWRDHFTEIRRIVTEFCACPKKYGSSERKWNYSCELLDESTFNCEDVEVRSRIVSQGYKVGNLYCDDLSLLPDSTVLNVSAYFERTRVPLPEPVGSIETVVRRRDANISIRYDSLLYQQYPSALPRSPGIFSMVFPVPLDPMHAYFEVSRGMVNYFEILEFYELVKRIHVEVGFSVTSGCLRDYFNVFGETGGGTDYDNLFRFDARGVNRLNSAFEEMRELRPGDDERYTMGDKFLYSVVTEYPDPVPIILRNPYKCMNRRE